MFVGPRKIHTELCQNVAQKDEDFGRTKEEFVMKESRMEATMKKIITT